MNGDSAARPRPAQIYLRSCSINVKADKSTSLVRASSSVRHLFRGGDFTKARHARFTGKVYVIKMMDRLWSLIKREIISS